MTGLLDSPVEQYWLAGSTPMVSRHLNVEHLAIFKLQHQDWKPYGESKVIEPSQKLFLELSTEEALAQHGTFRYDLAHAA